MKKFILSLAIFFIALPIIAQTTHRHSLELTIGDPFPIYITGQYYSCGCGPDMPLYENPDGSYTSIRADYLGHKWLPTFNLAYHYAPIPWAQIGLRMGYNYNYWGYHMTKMTGKPGGERTYEAIHGSEGRMFHHMGYIMASVRFPYFHRPLVQLYSGIAAGVAVDNYSMDHKPIGTTDTKATPAYQLTALGLHVGNNRIYGLIELGYGHQGFVNAGIGIAFGQ